MKEKLAERRETVRRYHVLKDAEERFARDKAASSAEERQALTRDSQSSGDNTARKTCGAGSA